MAGFQAPTVNDFLTQLYMHTERAVREFQRSKAQIDAECAKAGALQSSRRLLLALDAIEEHIEKGVSVLLGELRRASREPQLDALELRSLIGPRLDELVSRIIGTAGTERIAQSLQSTQLHEQIATRIDRIRGNVQFWLRQFDIGWDEPAEPMSLRPPPTPR